jgi:hypothetical protein
MVVNYQPTEQLLESTRRGVIPVFEVHSHWRSQVYSVVLGLPAETDHSISPEHGQSRYTPD